MLINAAGAKDIQRVKLFRHDGAGQVGGHAAAFPENMSVRMRNLVAVFRPGLTRQAFFMPKNMAAISDYSASLKIQYASKMS